MMRLLQTLVVLALAVCAPAAQAQNADGGAPEKIEIGLSTEMISITSNFSGEDLIVFGAVDNIDPLVLRQGRYDIFLALKGPRLDVISRRKGRVFGIWMNVDEEGFASVPQSYLVASTRLPRDISSGETLERLGLDTRALRMRAIGGEENLAADSPFADALRDIKHNTGLYQIFPGNVRFISQSLFRAELPLPANVPLGNHRVSAYLFKNGGLVAQTQSQLQIRKAGLEFAIFNLAQTQPLLYGLLAVLLALFVGWLGRVLFKKD
ncbi:MAG: TIGR02186 family protein [Ahrensia sp.]